MTRQTLVLAVLTASLLSGCGGPDETMTEQVSTLDIEAAPEPMADSAGASSETWAASVSPPPPPPPPPAARGQERTANAEALPPSMAAPLPVGMPQVAYTYAFGFRVPASAIRPMQERHADMCEAKGPQTCRIVSMNTGESEGDYAYGSLQLAIASDQARSFGKALTATSEGMNGELISSAIEGEDLSKRIVDTEARLRARTVLRDRLMEVLRTRRGTVAELVEAERGVAQVNEEIDQVRSWLTEMRGRVAYSTMTLEYQAGTPSEGGFLDPIRSAWGSLATIFGSILAVLMVIGLVILPLVLLVWGLVRVARRIGLTQSHDQNGWTRPDIDPTP